MGHENYFSSREKGRLATGGRRKGSVGKKSVMETSDQSGLKLEKLGGFVGDAGRGRKLLNDWSVERSGTAQKYLED